jgi:hypothetical protein
MEIIHTQEIKTITTHKSNRKTYTHTQHVPWFTSSTEQCFRMDATTAASPLLTPHCSAVEPKSRMYVCVRVCEMRAKVNVHVYARNNEKQN